MKNNKKTVQPGPGRPELPDKLKRKGRHVKMTDAEWSKIKKLAAAKGVTASEYVRVKALE